MRRLGSRQRHDVTGLPKVDSNTPRMMQATRNSITTPLCILNTLIFIFLHFGELPVGNICLNSEYLPTFIQCDARSWAILPCAFSYNRDFNGINDFFGYNGIKYVLKEKF